VIVMRLAALARYLQQTHLHIFEAFRLAATAVAISLVDRFHSPHRRPRYTAPRLRFSKTGIPAFVSHPILGLNDSPSHGRFHVILSIEEDTDCPRLKKSEKMLVIGRWPIAAMWWNLPP
jgi:hypothetical protein